MVLDYLDRDDQSTWEIDQLTGYDVYTGRVVERHLNLYGQVVREVRYRTRFMVPSRPVIGAGMGGGPSRGRGVRTLVGRAPRRSAIRTFPPGCGRGAKPLRSVTAVGPRPRYGRGNRGAARAEPQEESSISPMIRNPDLSSEKERVNKDVYPYYTPGQDSDDPSEESSGDVCSRVS